MRKLVLILFLLIELSHQTYSQGNLLEDDFSTSSVHWYEGQDSTYKVYVKDGNYVIDRTQPTSYTLFYSPVYIDPKKDFIIEALMTQFSGVDNYGYGLIWYSNNVAQHNSFEITSNGNYKIYYYANDETKYVKDWTVSDVIQPMKSPNKLTIKKKGNVTTFYINDHLITETSNIQHFGNDVGFEVTHRMKVGVDKITVKQDKGPINLLSGMSKGLVKENMGKNINSKTDEILPIISPDGKTLYFNREDHPLNTGDPKKSDIWYSTLNKDGTWSKAINIGFPLNNAGNNTVISVTPDNNTLLLMSTYNKDGSEKGSGFSLAHKTSTGWSVPQDITMKNFYNKGEYEEAYLSNDRKTILLTLNRDDSYGENDVYVSFLSSDGTWTEPKNLGPTINTYLGEIGPFLAADNITMYYSTAGKPGYGSNDIFVSKRLDDTWTKWSEPQNMGPDINSSDWDSYYVIPASGEYAYLCSQANSLGASDLFKIKLPTAAKPNPVVLVKGRVLNAKTKKPVEANISYEILPSGGEAGLAKSNPATGEYQIVLPYGTSYGSRANATGYLSVNENFDLTEKKDYIEITRDLYLVPIEVGQSFTLNNVFFEQSKDVMLPSSYPELDRLIQILKENPKIEIKLSGHTDNQGDAAKNMKLSENRVKAVKDYLISHNINTSRITGEGFGGTKPVANNTNEETRKLNRRVEFTITKK